MGIPQIDALIYLLSKYDRSDIVGIMLEHQINNDPIQVEKIKEAVIELYDSLENLPEISIALLEELETVTLSNELYDEQIEYEMNHRNKLETFQQKHPNTITKDNINNILDQLIDREMEDEIDLER